MMREIKFRAWQPANKMRQTSAMLRWEDLEREVNVEWLMRNAGKTGFELMQYTGLKDKNGVEIYEGDVVDLNGSIAVITWEWGGFSAKIIKAANPGDRKGLNYPMTMDGKQLLPFEVIGNVWENPDLLKGSHDSQAPEAN